VTQQPYLINIKARHLMNTCETMPPSTGNSGLDVLADAIADRVLGRLNHSDERRLLNVRDAAAYIGRTPKALRHMIAAGAVPAIREGSRIHLDRADLDRWIEMRKVR
jgi:excisionase family DNA binding protein